MRTTGRVKNMNKDYLFSLNNDPKAYEVMSQAGVKMAYPSPEYHRMNCCWELALSPTGELYFSLGSEAGVGDYAYLNRYDYEKNKMEYLIYTRDFVMPQDRAQPGSKIHTSIGFMPDGRLIFQNHNTDKSPNHPEWLPFAHFNHIYESFRGSNIFIYDPKTGKTEVLGIPVLHESMYGGVYDPKHNAYYMLGLFMGHMYRYSLDTGNVKDLGKAVEWCSHRIHLGPDGNVYGSTKTGYFFRVNTETEKLEYLGIRFPESPTAVYHNNWYRYVTDFINLDEHTMLLVCGFANEVYEYDVNTNELKVYYGRIAAKSIFKEAPGIITSFNTDIDKDGVLWYVLTVMNIDPDPDIKYNPPSYLFRWDYKNPGAEAECLGVMGSPDRGMFICSGVKIDREKDILYASECGNNDEGPVIMAIDLKTFRKHCGERSGQLKDKNYYPVEKTEEEKKNQTVEAMSVNNPPNPFPVEDVYPVRLWPEFPADKTESSAVLRVYFEDDETLIAILGEKEPEYAARIDVKSRKLISIDPLSDRNSGTASFSKDIIKNIPEITDVPYVAGRQYRRKITAAAEWHDGRTVIATEDGMVALVSDEGTYSLGQAAPYGPVRDMCTNAEKTMLWGTVGDDAEFGRVFTYDDKRGLRQLGMFRWQIPGENTMTVGSDILSSIELSPDEKTLAIGAQDRLGTVLLIDLSK